MLALRTTSPHFLYSASTWAPSASGVPSGKVTPCRANCSRTSGAEKASLACLFSHAMASFGVPAGTNSANHDDTTTFGTPASAMVGTSGRSAGRAPRR